MASLKQRGDVFYIQYYVGTIQKRISTGTDSYQLAKEKLRQFESAQLHGDDNPLPTRTPIADVVTAYVTHIRTVKTGKSAQTYIYYLRDAFGPICEALQVTSRKLSAKAKKRPPKPGQDRRRRAVTIEAGVLSRSPRRRFRNSFPAKCGAGDWRRKPPTGMSLTFLPTVSRYDLARFGVEVIRVSPRQADLLIVAGAQCGARV